MTSNTHRTASISGIADAKSKNPTQIKLKVNGQTVDPDSLKGLGLSTLESMLTDVDLFLSANPTQQKTFLKGLRETIKARAKGSSSCVTIDVTSTLDSKTKTLTHTIKVR